MRRDVWIGLVEVRPQSGNRDLDDAPGAYVNALGLASTEAEFERRVTAALAAMAFDATEFEDVEPFDVRLARSRPHVRLRQLADAVSEEQPVLFGTFHSYASEDE